MAVLDCVPGIEVTVDVDGEHAEEYVNDEAETEYEAGSLKEYMARRTVEKYIKSATGKSFVLKLKILASYEADCPGLVCTIYVDGELFGGPIWNADRGVPWMHIFEGNTSGTGDEAVIRTMKFSDIELGIYPIGVRHVPILTLDNSFR